MGAAATPVFFDPILYASSTYLSNNKSINSFYDRDTQSIYASISDTTGTVLEFGDSYLISSNTAFLSAVARHTDTKAVIFYGNFIINPNIVRYRICNISGTTITPGSINALSTIFTIRKLKVYALSDTVGVLIAVGDDSCYAYVYTISGDTVSFGPNQILPTDINTTDSYNNHQLIQIAPDKLLFTFTSRSSVYATALVLTRSGNTITYGVKTVIQSLVGNCTAVSKISDNKAVMMFTKQSTPFKYKTVILEISGTTITPGTIQDIPGENGTVIGDFDIVYLSNNKVGFSYDTWVYPTSQIYINTAEVSGTVLSFSAPELVITKDNLDLSGNTIAKHTDDNFVNIINYYDHDLNEYKSFGVDFNTGNILSMNHDIEYNYNIEHNIYSNFELNHNIDYNYNIENTIYNLLNIDHDIEYDLNYDFFIDIGLYYGKQLSNSSIITTDINNKSTITTNITSASEINQDISNSSWIK